MRNIRRDYTPALREAGEGAGAAQRGGGCGNEAGGAAQGGGAGGDRRGRQAGLTEPGRAGSPDRKSHGRHSPNRPRLGRWRSSLPVWTSTALSFRGLGRLPLPRPQTACCPPAFCPGACVSPHALPEQGHHTEATSPAHDHQPCSTRCAGRAGHVYREMDEHLQFKLTQRQLLLPQI